MYRKKLSLANTQEIDALIGTLVRLESPGYDTRAGIIWKRGGCDLYWTQANGEIDSKCLQNDTYVTTLDESVDEATEPSLNAWLRSQEPMRSDYTVLPPTRVEYRTAPMRAESPLITWAQAQVDSTNFTRFSLNDDF